MDSVDCVVVGAGVVGLAAAKRPAAAGRRGHYPRAGRRDPFRRRLLHTSTFPVIPALVVRFVEFFAAVIRNPHTRRAHGRAVAEFLAWCKRAGVRA